MTAISFDIHNVSRVSVETRKVARHQSIPEDYIVHNVVIHYKDNLGQLLTLDLNIYGDWGLAEVPFMFGGCVVETGKVEEEV